MKLRIFQSGSNGIPTNMLFRATIFTVAATLLLGGEIAANGAVQLAGVEFRWPEAETPYFHVRAKVSPLIEGSLALKSAEINGEPARGGRWDQKKGLLALPVRWRAGQSYKLRVTLGMGDEKTLSAEASAQAPTQGGMWHPDWAHYASVILAEEAGIERKGEPVHVTLSVYADQVTHMENEVRVVRLDRHTGAQKEVPSQVYAVSTWTRPADDIKYEPTRYQSTTTCEVAFLADVEANAKQFYLIYYGNPNARKPAYESDLKVTGRDPALTIANSVYEVRLHPKSGVIDEIRLHGSDEVFAHKIETNGAVHWNPGCYAPPRPWVHASDWDPPAGMATIRGPVLVMVKRWGPLPEMPEVIVSITYRFYAGNPHIFMSSGIEVNEDIHVQALRNGEIVLNRDFINSFAWEDQGGTVHGVAVADVPQHPTHGLEIAPDTPWVAFYSSEKGLALGGIQLGWTNVRPRDGLPRLEQPYIYLQVGRWVYWARPLVYPFGSTNPQRLVLVPEGSRYYEEMVFLPFRLGPAHDRFAPVQEGRRHLTRPLYVSLYMDIDKRVPGEWVWPLLVAPFEEILKE